MKVTSMNLTAVKIIPLAALILISGWAGAQEEGAATGLENRIDFGNAYVNGQTIKSGAVYLMHRKKNEIESMLKPRKNYRAEILEGFSVSKEVEALREKSIDVSSKN